jgi:glycosyltransferase involved in cell wall biosynthesis
MANSISVVVPSFNDDRILRAIRSIRVFDDLGTVKIVVVDGGSREEIRAKIRSVLHDTDVFISEPDKGIFDALNKGLDICDTEYMGWLGSDDFYTGHVKASEVTNLLSSHDMVVVDVAHFRGRRVSRLTHSFPSRFRLARFGLNVPHFGSFGRRTLLASRRFDISDRSADQDYFISLLGDVSRVATVGKVGVLAEEGGFSTASRKKILFLNLELFHVYKKHVGAFLAPFCIIVKLSYKTLSALLYRVRNVKPESMCLFDVAA